MSKTAKDSGAGLHLLRVRIRKSIWDRLQLAADDESERSGEHVTVSDLVRAAFVDLLLKHEALKRLENAPEEFFADEMQGLTVTLAAMV